MKYTVLLINTCLWMAMSAPAVAAPTSPKQLDLRDKIAPPDTAGSNSDVALLHVYRHGGPGFLIGYDLYLGDTVICHVLSKWKTTIRIRKGGAGILWAKTEAKEELPITLEAGKEYYVRCGMTMGAFVGHPSLKLMDESTGSAEFKDLKLPKELKRDIVTLKSGKRIECVIKKEDNENVYCTIIRNDKPLDTHIPKSSIDNIQRME